MTPDETLNRATLWNRLEGNVAKLVTDNVKTTDADLAPDLFNVARTFFNDVGRIASALEHIADNTKDV